MLSSLALVKINLDFLFLPGRPNPIIWPEVGWFLFRWMGAHGPCRLQPIRVFASNLKCGIHSQILSLTYTPPPYFSLVSSIFLMFDGPEVWYDLAPCHLDGDFIPYGDPCVRTWPVEFSPTSSSCPPIVGRVARGGRTKLSQIRFALYPRMAGVCVSKFHFPSTDLIDLRRHIATSGFQKYP